VLQYKSFNFEFNGETSSPPQIYVDKTPLLSSIRNLVQSSGSGASIDSVDYLTSLSPDLTHLDPIFIDVALDQIDEVFSSLGIDLSKTTFTNQGPIDISSSRARVASTVYWSASGNAFWSAKLRNAPELHTFSDAIVHIELADPPSGGWNQQQKVPANLNNLEVYLTSDLSPQDRSDLLPSGRIFREDFESVTSFLSSGRASPPSGLKAWTSISKSLSIPNGGLQLIQTPVTRGGGAAVGFWLWNRGSGELEKGLVLVDLQNTGGSSFLQIGFDPRISNALRIHVKFNDRYERIVNTKSDVVPTDQWVHVIIRIGPEISQRPEPSLFINSQNINLGGVRFLSSVNVETYQDKVKSMSFWYSDGSRGFEPTSMYGSELTTSSSTISIVKNDQTFEIWDIDIDNDQIISIKGSSDMGNPTLILSVKSVTGSIFLEKRINFVRNQGHSSVEVDTIDLIGLSMLSDSTLYIELSLILSGAPSNTNVEYTLHVTSGILRSRTGSFDLDFDDDEHLTKVDAQTSAISSSTHLGIRVSNVTSPSGGGTNKVSGSQAAPWFAKQSDLPNSEGESDVDFETTTSYLELVSPPNGNDIVNVNIMSMCMWIKIDDISEPLVIAAISEESGLAGVSCSQISSARHCSSTNGARSSPKTLILGIGGSSSASLTGSRSWSPFMTSSCPIGFSLFSAGDSSVCAPIGVNKRAAFQATRTLTRYLTLTE